MTGCEYCGVGPDDECTMDCPSRREGWAQPPPDAGPLERIAALLALWLHDETANPADEILADIAAQVTSAGVPIPLA